MGRGGRAVREGRGEVKSAEAKKQWTFLCMALSKSVDDFPDKVWLSFNWKIKSRSADPDNIAAAAKYVMDGLVDAGKLKKDSLMIIQTPVIHHYGKGDGSLELTISDRPIYELVEL